MDNFLPFSKTFVQSSATRLLYSLSTDYRI